MSGSPANLPTWVRLVLRYVCAQFAELRRAAASLANPLLPVMGAHVVVKQLEIVDDASSGARRQAAEAAEHGYHVDREIEHPDLLGRVVPQVLVIGVPHLPGVAHPGASGATARVSSRIACCASGCALVYCCTTES